MLENLLEISIDIIVFLQTQLAWLTPVMRFFTFLGDEEFYLLIMPFLVWSMDYDLGLRLGVMLMLSGTINSYLKVGFHQPRPYWVSKKIQNLISPMGSFGLPSGHSQNAASVFGLLSASTGKKWFKGVIIFTILMIALSRLFLGVHSLADILLGLLVGAVLLAIFLKFENNVITFFRKKKPLVCVGLVFAISILLVLLGVLVVSIFQDTPLPKEWFQNAIIAHPEKGIPLFSIDGLLTTAGTLFGLVAGGIWMKKTGGYNAKAGKFWQHLLRFIIGIAGILLIWKGLGGIFPRNEDLISYSLRWLRYALIGIWITGIAPFIFIYAKLGGKEGK